MSELAEQVTMGDTAEVHKTSECGHNQNIIKLPLQVRALRNLQLKTKSIQSDFFEKIYELEIEYQEKHDLVYKKRCDIVNGIYVPTEGEGDISHIDEPTFTTTKNDQMPANIEQPSGEQPSGEQPSGIPKFWLNVLSATLFEIHEKDLPILEHITDVRAKNNPFSELGFVLEFDFSPNEFFENETLTKEYLYTCSLGNKMVFEGPQIYKSIGCEIKWKGGKTTSKDSFFYFFRSVETKIGSEELLESEKYAMKCDFEMGYFIKERIIPRAVLFYNEKRCTGPYLPSVYSSSSSFSLPPSSSYFAPSQAKHDDDTVKSP